MFKSSRNQYARNLEDAAKFNATPALMGAPTGVHEPGVVLKYESLIKVVMPIPDALRLANEIADSVAAHRASTAGA